MAATDIEQLGWRAGARDDLGLYGVALLSLGLGFAMQPLSGNRPDWDLTFRVLGKFWTVGLVFLLLAAGWRLAWLALVARSRQPSRDLARSIAALCVHLPTLANTLAIFVLFALGQGVLKGAIAVISPFAWDDALSELDRVLHFGRAPYEWLSPLLARPWALSGINIAYHVWFFLQIGSIIAIAFAKRRLRRRYLLAYMLTWLIGGFLVAVTMSSAGPVFYARLGLGDDYRPLTDAMAAAAENWPIWALEVQDKLWAGFTGDRYGSAGISAFPSMHVATATLFVLAARRIGPRIFAAAVAFWMVTMLGSVVLAWHYAVDGYAGALIAVVVWRGCGVAQGHLATGGSDMSTASGLWPVSSPKRVPRS